MKWTAIYDEFLEGYEKSGGASPEQVGITIVKLAQVYTAMNTAAAGCEMGFNRKFAELANGVDSTGKAISAAKAEIEARASTAYEAHDLARRELESIEMAINALKALQRGLQTELGQSSMT